MNIKRWVGLAVIIIGVGLVSYEPIINYWIAPNNLNKEYDGLKDLTNEDLRVNEERLKMQSEKLFDFANAASISSRELFNAKVDPSMVIGFVSIPSVDIKLPILYGATHENMLVGAGTLKPDQRMGEGNYVLSSHNAKNPNILFAPIRRISKGDLIYVTDKDAVYIYKATQKEVIEPERVEVIQDTDGQNEITLLSCYASDGSNRIIIKGEFIEVVSLDSMNESERQKIF